MFTLTYFSPRRLLIGLLILTVIAACQSKEQEIIPTPAFSHNLLETELANYVPSYPVGFAIKFTNRSTDGVTYNWNFGNGSTSSEKDPTITYLQPGTYTVQLTTTSSSGNQQTTSQSITVLNCVLKQITITGFRWNDIGAVPTWGSTKRADLTLELGQRSLTGSPVVVSNSFYKTEPVKDVVNTTSPFTIPVTRQVVVNPASLLNFIVNLYGNDGSGNQLVYSSGASGIGYSSGFSTTTRLFTIESGPITLEFNYK